MDEKSVAGKPTEEGEEKKEERRRRGERKEKRQTAGRQRRLLPVSDNKGVAATEGSP